MAVINEWWRVFNSQPHYIDYYVWYYIQHVLVHSSNQWMMTRVQLMINDDYTYIILNIVCNYYIQHITAVGEWWHARSLTINDDYTYIMSTGVYNSYTQPYNIYQYITTINEWWRVHNSRLHHIDYCIY